MYLSRDMLVRLRTFYNYASKEKLEKKVIYLSVRNKSVACVNK